MENVITAIQSSRKEPLQLTIEPERCKGCGFCVEFCPKEALGISTDQFNAKGYYPAELCHPELCIGCGLCEMYCPDFAIYVTRATAEPILAAQLPITEETKGEE